MVCVYKYICIYVLRLKRKPLEGQMQFNRRSFKLLCKWCSRTGTKMLHHRVLQSAHRQAWREDRVNSGLDEDFLGALRNERNRMIWIVMKTEPIHERRACNLTKRCKNEAKKVMWEGARRGDKSPTRARQGPARAGWGPLNQSNPEAQAGPDEAFSHSTSCPGRHGGGYTYLHKLYIHCNDKSKCTITYT